VQADFKASGNAVNKEWQFIAPDTNAQRCSARSRELRTSAQERLRLRAGPALRVKPSSPRCGRIFPFRVDTSSCLGDRVLLPNSRNDEPQRLPERGDAIGSDP